MKVWSAVCEGMSAIHVHLYMKVCTIHLNVGCVYCTICILVYIIVCGAQLDF